MTKILILSSVIFSIGAYGVIARRNLLIVMMSVELMLNGVNIALVGFARQYSLLAHITGGSPDYQGHVFVLMVMAVAAAEVAVGLAILIMLFRNRRTVDSGDLTTLHG